MLYRDLAPISNEAWKEIDERAEEVLKAYLSARKVVHVKGPKGLEYNVIPEGRLTSVEEVDGVSYGIYKVLPLLESRIEFEMDRWELDNVNRGAKDVEFEPLEEAMKKLALFEENSIYNSCDQAIVHGMNENIENAQIDFGNNPTEIMEAISKGLLQLRMAYAEGPFTLVVNKEAYKRILSKDSGYPLDRRIENLIGGKIIFSHVVKGAYLLPYNHEDLELTIGRDYSIGYQSHNAETVRFFATESFTFRVLDPALIVKLKV
jgi:uncharacterized linocin/CFP29 family protein